MTIPMIAGTYPNALLYLIRAAAERSEDRNRLDRAPLNVNLDTYTPTHAPLPKRA